MSEFIVTGISGGNTFKILNGWSWEGKRGVEVRAAGYVTPEKGNIGYEETCDWLRELILGRMVEIKSPRGVDEAGRLVAEVYFRGKNLTEYFPEYKI